MKVEKETLVLGVGNLLLKDEGVGIHEIGRASCRERV